MNEFAERIERDFPVRRKEKEKVDFRTWLVYTLKELGYSPKLESGTSALSATSSRKPIAKISPARFGCCEAADLLSARQSREACSARCRIIRPAMASFLMPNRARFLPAKRKFCIFSRRV